MARHHNVFYNHGLQVVDEETVSRDRDALAGDAAPLPGRARHYPGDEGRHDCRDLPRNATESRAREGGARAKVQDVTIVDSEHEPLGGEIGFVSTCTWNVSGSVGHWGHVHTCENQYQARFVVKSVDGLWKITELELLPEERLPG